MISYQAPNPYSRPHTSSNSFFAPIKRGIGKIVLHAQSIEHKKLSTRLVNKLTEMYSLEFSSIKITTHDGATLDTIQLAPKSNQPVSLDKQRFIIKFNGNDMLFSYALSDYAYDAAQLNVAVVGFNYRGVGMSTKAPERLQDLITDGIAQVQRLLDLGVDSKNITLDGISLGGGIATMVAAHFHHMGKPIFLWNDRSFSSISKAAAGIVTSSFINVADKVLCAPIQSIVWVVINPAGWDADVASAYKSIPKEYKGYVLVEKPCLQSYGDGTISHSASLHSAVKKSELTSHGTTGHRVLAQSTLYDGGHNMPRDELVSGENRHVTAQDLFEQFIKHQAK